LFSGTWFSRPTGQIATEMSYFVRKASR